MCHRKITLSGVRNSDLESQPPAGEIAYLIFSFPIYKANPHSIDLL